MRRWLAVFAGLLLLLACTGAASASEGVLDAQAEALDLDGLENAGAEWVPNADLAAGLDLDGSIDQILDTGSAEIGGVIRKALRSGALSPVSPPRLQAASARLLLFCPCPRRRARRCRVPRPLGARSLRAG